MYSLPIFPEYTAPALIFFAVFLLYFWLSTDGLRHIPGPLLARTPVWLAYQTRMANRYWAVDQAHKRYGPVVRISQNHVSIADRDMISVVYAHGIHSLDKTQYYDAFISERPSVFSTRNKEIHARKRRIVSHALSKSALNDFEPFLQANITDFVAAVDRLSASKVPFDLFTWVNYLTFDVLSDLVFGAPIGMLISGSDKVQVLDADGGVRMESAIDLVAGREHLAAVLGTLPSMYRRLTKLIPDPFFHDAQNCSAGLVGFARQKISERLKSSNPRGDILSKLTEAFCRQSGIDELPKDDLAELVSESVTLLAAGSDGIASSAGAIIHFVANNPAVCAALRAELVQSLGDDTDALPTPRTVVNLPYLRATILEGIRLHSTIASGLPRYAPDGGLNVNGISIPAKTEISIPPYTVHHDASWGDPEQYRPERWLTEDNNDLKRTLLFGHGPRACLGMHLAFMEMRLIISTLFMRYDIETLSSKLVSLEGFVRKVEKLPVKISRRV